MFKNQKGNAALFVLVCLPIVLSFAILVVDVSNYQIAREKAQEYSDELVLHAAKFLPDMQAAQSYILGKINIQNIYTISDLEVEADSLSLTLSAEIDSLFDVFLNVVTGKSQSFSVREKAAATLSPIDLVLIIPDGLSMRPAVRQYWGDWPTSTYFNLVSPPQVLQQGDMAEHVWPLWWEDFSNYSKWATQSCFNPVFSAVKSVAISLIDNFSKLRNSRIAVITTPGNDLLLGYSLILSTGGELFENRLNYWEEENYLSDELCALISQQNNHYKTITTVNCFELVDNQISKQIYYPRGLVSECVKQGGLNAQEAIYYRVARKFISSEDSYLSALQTALAQIAIKPSSQIQQNRANLNTLAKKEILLLIDRPIIRSERLLELWNNSDVLLTIVPFYTTDDKISLYSYAEELRSLALSNLRVYNPVEAKDLIEKVLPEVMQSNQQVLLKS